MKSCDIAHAVAQAVAFHIACDVATEVAHAGPVEENESTRQRGVVVQRRRRRPDRVRVVNGAASPASTTMVTRTTVGPVLVRCVYTAGGTARAAALRTTTPSAARTATSPQPVSVSMRSTSLSVTAVTRRPAR